MIANDVQYVADEDGVVTAVIIPVTLWREITSERATAYLLQSPAMRTRLLEALARTESIALDEVRAQLGL